MVPSATSRTRSVGVVEAPGVDEQDGGALVVRQAREERGEVVAVAGRVAVVGRDVVRHGRRRAPRAAALLVDRRAVDDAEQPRRERRAPAASFASARKARR